MSFDEKFQAGEAYGDSKGSSPDLGDPVKLATAILKDYSGVRSRISVTELASVIKTMLFDKGKPLDDKNG
jgi:hypothetical protein